MQPPFLGWSLFHLSAPLVVDDAFRTGHREWGFPGCSVIKNLPANAGDTGGLHLIPGLGRSPGGGNDNPLQYSCLKVPRTEEPGGLHPHESMAS